MAKADYSTWITKQDAAQVIGVSTKAIERWAQEKQIQVARWKGPAGGPTRVVCHPADVARIARARNPGTETFVIPAPKEQPVKNGTIATRQPTGDQFLQALASALGSPQISQRGPAALWLTLQEAVGYSGLPEATLRDLIASGRLPVLDVGKGRRGGRYRIRQVDLRKLEARAVPQPHQNLPAQTKQV
jgi:hypothetical protein